LGEYVPIMHRESLSGDSRRKKWFDHLKSNNIHVMGYVIMPNHMHVLLYFPKMEKSLNTIVGNAKRFMAYEIINRLEKSKKEAVLERLYSGVKKTEKKKGQIHKVFEDSFDAKECHTEKFIFQKLQYMHLNPVSKKWNLVNDFIDYQYSSAAFYEAGVRVNNIIHVNDVLSGVIPGSPYAQSQAVKTPGGP
jgi:REP element-mobilizing transposase RayT